MKRLDCSNFNQLNAVNHNSLLDIPSIKDISDGISNWSLAIKNLTLGIFLLLIIFLKLDAHFVLLYFSVVKHKFD